MFFALIYRWNHLNYDTIRTKLMTYYKRYAKNKHKTTVLTPGLHISDAGNDSNRFDLKPFVYNT